MRPKQEANVCVIVSIGLGFHPSRLQHRVLKLKSDQQCIQNPSFRGSKNFGVVWMLGVELRIKDEQGRHAWKDDVKLIK